MIHQLWKGRRVRVAGALKQVAVDCPDDLARIYRDYWELVFRRCEATLEDREAAEDATQDVFLAALNCFEDIRGDVVRGLMDLARTISYERKRRPLREVPLADPPNGHHRTDDPAEIAERNRVLDALWEGLSPVERRYVADKFAGFSFEEIAHRNRRALGTVSSNLARAREHARRIGEPLLLGSLAALAWRRLTDLGRRARTAAQDSSVLAAAQPVGSLTVSLTLAGLIVGAVPAATAAQAVAARPLVPAAASPYADLANPMARIDPASQAAPTTVVPVAPRASNGAALSGLPSLLPSSSAASETPEDTGITAATASPNYQQDHTIVALGRGAHCSCQVLLLSTDGGATWSAEAAPPAGNQIVLSPRFPQDPAIFIGYSNGSGTLGDYWSRGFGQPFSLLPGAPAGSLALPAGFDAGDNRIIVANAAGAWSYDMASGVIHALLLDPTNATPSLATPAGRPDLGILVMTSSQAVGPSDAAHATALGPAEIVWTCPAGRACSQLASVDLPAGAHLVASPAFASDQAMAAFDASALLTSTGGDRGFDSVSLPAGALSTSYLTLTSTSQGAALWATIQSAGGWRLLAKTSLDAPWRDIDSGDAAITARGGHLVVVGSQRLLFLLAQGGLRCSVNGGVTWEARCPAA